MMMKLVAGLGSVDEYIPYVQAGADELFCGYVPDSFMYRFGASHPLNRREVLYYNVQLGSFSELEILGKMIQQYHVPVTITLNSPFYIPEQYPAILDIIDRCRAIGFHSFILADPALLLYLHQNGLTGCNLHVSGETAEANHRMVEELRALGAGRVIFHRKTEIRDMKTCILRQTDLHPEAPLEYEAFALNEMCHFTGAFCNSLHCDELTHICRVPYRLGGLHGALSEEQGGGTGTASTKDTGPETQPGSEVNCDFDGYLTGQSGCGLCALWKLREAGLTHLKLVSRGNYEEDTIRDIRQLKNALTILDASRSENEYQFNMKRHLFPSGPCSGQCYYR